MWWVLAQYLPFGYAGRFLLWLVVLYGGYIIAAGAI